MRRLERTLSRFAAGALLAAALGCDNVGKLAPLEPSPEEIDGVSVCGGEQTFGELKRQDEVSEECRSEIELLLGEPTSTFDARLIVLGESRAEDGSRVFYVQGADSAASDALDVEITRASGKVTKLPRAELRVTPVEGDIIALAVASDTSRTLRDADLRATAELLGGLFAALPPGFEASVTRFSSEVRVVQEPTTDTALLARAVEPDEEFPQEQTALYDGLSAALAALEASERPIRLLFVVSDGPDNLPSTTRRGELRARIEAGGIAGAGAAALFADPLELRALFGARGVTFQTPSLQSLPDALAAYRRSLGAIVALRVPPQTDAVRYRIALGDVGVVAPE